MASGMVRPSSRRRGQEPEPMSRPKAPFGPSRIQIWDNPIAARDPVLGQALEQAVGEALRDEDLGPVQVRFSLWRDGTRALKFVCKVEARGDEVNGTPPWRWWSSLTRKPEQLHDDLARGLRTRRERLGYGPTALRNAREC